MVKCREYVFNKEKQLAAQAFTKSSLKTGNADKAFLKNGIDYYVYIQGTIERRR
jgi:hypothetical protein